MKRGGAVAISILLLFGICAPEPAAAQCQQWDLTGKWEFWQSNRHKLELDLRQDPINGDLAGKAQFSGEVEIGGVFGTDLGKADIPSTWYGTVITGRLTGNRFVFVVDWGNPAHYGRGEYKGEVGPEGQLQGSTADTAHPEQRATWHEWAGRRAKCLTASVPSSAGADPHYQSNTNMPGSDYSSFETRGAADAECSIACGKDPQCKAWTWSKPGVQAPKGKCWLKNAVPAAVADECCISGLQTKVKVLGKTKERPLGKAKAGKAKDDVDVFDSPVDPRQVIGMLPAGKTAKYLDHHPDGWTKLQGVANGGADGWVADDHLIVTGTR
jgi:hypothetical protein